MSKRKQATSRVKQALKKRNQITPLSVKDYLSTGSTLLNLACTGKWQGGIPKGFFVYFVGDTQSGKTFLSMTCFAEATINAAFADYRLIYDGTEHGALMDLRKFFGDRVADQLEPPRRDKETNEPINSRTIEDFYFNLDDALDEGPCIYVLDSQDSLSSDSEGKKFRERKAANRKGTKKAMEAVKGDFGDGKAKVSSRNIRQMLDKIHKTGSILVVINQTRDNINAGPFERKTTHSGGRALEFYATIKLWSSVGGSIKKEVRKKKRQLGINATVRVEKTRVTGRHRMVKVPIYHSVGIDDIGGCVDYLVDEQHWSKNNQGVIDADEFDVALRREDLVAHIEEEELEVELRMLVAEVWNQIEKACAIKRKPRY